ncbi:response regulator with CheY-like receiver, AAA-type ATPase, and DNA-binding domains [Beggiatoa alba B18LD]|uniref:Response regulator with CheY-like receiver, AAA-type ATPase, and DNA-binding domains n=1 Tax=Beggiatoa alba B18LD TaxID=395493 RepID=I3CCJ1_9GAMM|nr:response regulator [Beggiatoa alba]EIJ41334.1 response regulator with CheY-like receiver, AAA-type ATPase, and DNA-binding domains [Beggiatoa alba B18LD]
MNTNKYQILAVDDEQEMREELNAILKDDFIVTTANDGEAGLKQLIKNDFDIAIIDLKMPKMDGLELIKQIKAKNIQIPLVLLTGKGGVQDAFEASKLGVDKWVEKSSLNIDDFIKILLELVQKIPDYHSTYHSTVKTLTLKNFTAFSNETFEFSPQLNIFIGENATGKTHILKSCYATLSAVAERNLVDINPDLGTLNVDLSDKFFRVFRPDFLNNLIRYQQEQAEIQLSFENPECDLQLFLQKKEDKIQLQHLPAKYINKTPVYISTREMLGIYQNFQAIYDKHYMRLDETWRDVCVALGGLELRQIDERLQTIVNKIEEFIGGKLELDKNGNFYLNTPQKGRLEAQLISEGQRKLAMLSRLIQTNALQNGYLFWDEPEANLNPHFIKEIAPILLELSKHGVQVFIATHSLFLLREIEICLTEEQYKKVQVRWFGLQLDKETNNTVVTQANDIDDIGDITASEEQLMQSVRFMRSNR